MGDSAYHKSDKVCHSCGRGNKSLRKGLCGMCYTRQLHTDPNRPRCLEVDCNGPAIRKGLCDKHYERQRRRDQSRPKCSVEQCSNRAVSCGFCDKHYSRARTYGDPLAGRTFCGDPMKFLVNEVIPSTEEEYCIIWPFGRFPSGAALISENRVPRKTCQIVLEMTAGPAPEGKGFALHKCGKGHLGCCNPNHLYWGNHHENMRDMVDHGTSTKGERNCNAKLTVGLVHYIRRVAKEKTMSYRELARRLNVTRNTIENIVHRKTWAWLD